jgi:CRISPR-associated protein Cas2
MKKKYNYNYAILFYDIRDEKRLKKVFKICKKYLAHFQYSVFRGDITPSNLILLSNELKNVIDQEEDFICIVKTFNDNVFDEEILGNKKFEEDDLII